MITFLQFLFENKRPYGGWIAPDGVYHENEMGMHNNSAIDQHHIPGGEKEALDKGWVRVADQFKHGI